MPTSASVQRLNRRAHSTITAAIVSLLVAACSSNTAVSSSAEPVDGGTLTVALNSAVSGLDPQFTAANVSRYVTRQIVDSLLYQDPQDGSLQPWLATSWEVSEDGLTYRFTLRDDVTFTDGSTLTAEVVKANFDHVAGLDPKLAPLMVAQLEGYESTEVLGDHDLAVHFSTPNAGFLQAASTVGLGILSAATVTVSQDARAQGELIGSGPFALAEVDLESAISLVRNDAYDWAPEAREHQGPAYLDEVVFRIIPEGSVRTGQLLSGEVDVDPWLPDQDIERVEAAGGSVVGEPFPGVDITVTTNSQRPLLQDQRVRQALILATDREEIVSSLLTEFDKPATSLIASTTPGYQPIGAVRFDSVRAEELLDEAGWVRGSGEIRERDGVPLRLDLVVGTGTRMTVPVLQVLQQQYRDVGIDLNIVNETLNAQATALFTSGEWDLRFQPANRASWSTVRSTFGFDASNLARRTERGPIDDALDAAYATLDEAEQQAEVTAAITALIDAGYVNPIFEIANIYGTSSRVHDLGLDATTFLELHDTWVS